MADSPYNVPGNVNYSPRQRKSNIVTAIVEQPTSYTKQSKGIKNIVTTEVERPTGYTRQSKTFRNLTYSIAKVPETEALYTIESTYGDERYNVPGNIHYNEDLPLDNIIQSVVVPPEDDIPVTPPSDSDLGFGLEAFGLAPFGK